MFVFSFSGSLNGTSKGRVTKGDSQMVDIFLCEVNVNSTVQVGTMFIKYGLQKAQEEARAEGEGMACLRAHI